MAQPVAKIVVPIISVGLAEFALSRTPIIVAGIKVIQEVLRLKK